MTPAPSASSTDGPSTASAERAVLTTAALGTMLAPLNSTMLAVALPSIMAEFDADIATVGWLVTGYLIGMVAVQPLAGTLGDRVGRRPLILGGLTWFGLASLGATAAESPAMLLFFRVQQALAGAMALPNAAALVREVVPAERRASRFGQIGALIALAAAAGPPLGGLPVDALGWRAIFWANVPIVAAALLIGRSALRAAPPPSSARPAWPTGSIGCSCWWPRPGCCRSWPASPWTTVGGPRRGLDPERRRQADRARDRAAHPSAGSCRGGAAGPKPSIGFRRRGPTSVASRAGTMAAPDSILDGQVLEGLGLAQPEAGAGSKWQ